MRRCEEISRAGSPHSTARGWQSSGACGDETKARAMHPPTFNTCNLYPREVSSSSERSLIPIGPRTPPEPERFHSRGANLAQPSDATPLPRHLRSHKRPAFSTGSRIQFCPGDIQLAHRRGRASRFHGGGFAGEEVRFTEVVEKRTHCVRCEADGDAKDARATPTKNHDGKPWSSESSGFSSAGPRRARASRGRRARVRR